MERIRRYKSLEKSSERTVPPHMVAYQVIVRKSPTHKPIGTGELYAGRLMGLKYNTRVVRVLWTHGEWLRYNVLKQLYFGRFWREY